MCNAYFVHTKAKNKFKIMSDWSTDEITTQCLVFPICDLENSRGCFNVYSSEKLLQSTKFVFLRGVFTVHFQNYTVWNLASNPCFIVSVPRYFQFRRLNWNVKIIQWNCLGLHIFTCYSLSSTNIANSSNSMSAFSLTNSGQWESGL